jgi:hypothetical protein
MTRCSSCGRRKSCSTAPARDGSAHHRTHRRRSRYGWPTTVGPGDDADRRCRRRGDTLAGGNAGLDRWILLAGQQIPQIGGWELDDGGGIRHLTSPIAYAIGRGDGTGISGGALKESCDWCGMALWRVLDFEGLVAGTCIRCGCYTTVFTDQDPDGAVRWADENSRPQFLGHDGGIWELPDDLQLHIDAARPTPYAGSAWDAGGSTFGGLPDWIQDPEYPTCPRCDKTMMYRAMITGADMWDGSAEGCLYVFADTDCRLSAVVYQQS